MMFGSSGRVSAKIGARVRGGALALIYVLLSLNLPVLLDAALRSARPEASAVAAQAIAVSGATGTDVAAESGHACCCKHSGDECEMGCCARKHLPTPGEACFRNCSGPVAHQGSIPSALESHLAATSASMPSFLSCAVPLPNPVGTGSSLFRDPPEKIPIV
jgi:hypothetical protein